MALNTTITTFLNTVELGGEREAYAGPQKSSLIFRMAKRLALYMDRIATFIQNQLNEHTAASIASCGILIIILSIITFFIIRLMREEEKRIKEQYKKLQAGSSQSFIAVAQNSSSATKVHDCFNDFTKVYQKSSFNQFHSGGYQQIVERRNNQYHASKYPDSTMSTHILYNHHQQQQPCRSDKQVRLIEMRRETYFGLVRLSKPGCRSIVLLCDAQSKAKLLSKFYQCVYPYRKNKSLQFSYLLIEKNIGWYKDLLKSALCEKRYLRINPINCIGTVLVLNGFKKYFSIYHASDARWSPPDDPPFVLLEEALLDNLTEWLERVFAGKVNRYYVRSWPDKIQYIY